MTRPAAKFSASFGEMISHEFDFLAHVFRQSCGSEQSDRIWCLNCFIPKHQFEQAVETPGISLRAAKSIVHCLIKFDHRRPFRGIDVERQHVLSCHVVFSSFISRSRSSWFRYAAQWLSQAAGERLCLALSDSAVLWSWIGFEFDDHIATFLFLKFSASIRERPFERLDMITGIHW